jgi:3-deoxy-manno-octulosonate cytidylyltransferase (CMP-KDO synthetase)
MSVEVSKPIAKPRFKAVVPARFASTRLPGKPLLDICGKPMVVRVAERALASGADEVIVATDHEDILAACKEHEITSVMTRSDWPSGTDRISEVAKIRGWSDDQIVVNVQGDEPLIDPKLIRNVAYLLANTNASISTCAHPIESWEDFCNPNIVKIAMGAKHRAVYFSRAPVPYPRDIIPEHLRGPLPAGFKPLRHVGLYAYRVSFLRAYATWPVSELDSLECLEQLRALYHEHEIVVSTLDHAPAPGVDTQQDLERVRGIWKSTHPHA